MRAYYDRPAKAKRKHPARKPPVDFARSRWWHACCYSCWKGRHGGGAKGTLPAHTTEDIVRCCICGGPYTLFRIRVSPRDLPCRGKHGPSSSLHSR